MDFTLEDILSEYRVWPESVAAAESGEPSHPLTMEPGEGGVAAAGAESGLAADLRDTFEKEEPLAEPPEPPRKKHEKPTPPREKHVKPAPPREKHAKPAPPQRPRRVWPAPNAPAEERAVSEEELLSVMFTPEELKNPETIQLPPVADESFEDDTDFYAGPVAPEKPASEEDEAPSGEELPGEAPAEETPRPKKGKKGLSLPNVSAAETMGKVAGFLGRASERRDRNREQKAPEPEDAGTEMSPDKASRHYAAQLPALRLRAFGTALVCLLMLWLTVSCRFGAGLPGRLATDIRLASMVELVALITVALLGLDVLTAGTMSLFRGRPGAESLLSVAMFTSALDLITVIVTRNGDRGLPYAILPAVGVLFALWGGWQTGAAYHDSFLAVFHAAEPSVVTTEELPERRLTAVIKSRRSPEGFVRRSEEPSAAETLAESAFYPLTAAAVALSFAVTLGSRDFGAFFHILSLMTALAASWSWLFAFPALFAKAARRLLFRGAALAGWSGVRDTGAARCLVVRDTDVFPEETVEITGIRLLDKTRAREIISLTGSMLSAAGAGNAGVFTELMRRHNAALLTVEDLSIGEGGCKGTVDGKEIRTGTVGYMHLSGVKVPDKLRNEIAVYTAEDGELSGVFLFRYRPIASVQRALWSLRKERRKPIFAVRDFNLDPMLLRQEFEISTEGFEFPPFAERYRISGKPMSSRSPVNGVLAEDGLESLVELTESARRLYFFGRVCAWGSLAAAGLGMLLMVPACWTGNWSLAGALNALVYMLLWMIPTAVCLVLTKK